MFISLSSNCHPAGNLRKLDLRKESLPFDWLLCGRVGSKEIGRIFEYIHNNHLHMLVQLIFLLACVK